MQILSSLTPWISIVVVLGVSAFILRYFLGIGIGAPWLPIRRRYLNVAFDEAEIQPGDTVIDLGSGDGKILIEAVKRGANVIGYELNPFLVWISRWRLKRFSDRAVVYRQNLFEADVSEADTIFVFGFTDIMSRLATKLKREARTDARIISFAFDLPGLKLIRQKEIVKIYSTS